MTGYLRKITSLFDAGIRLRFLGLFVLMFAGSLLEMIGVGLFWSEPLKVVQVC